MRPATARWFCGPTRCRSNSCSRPLNTGFAELCSATPSRNNWWIRCARWLAGELQIGFGAARDGAQPRRKISLTPREREIVSLLRQGMRNKQIAGEMGITEGTVKIYLFRLFHKLGVRNRFELARCGTLEQLQLTPRDFAGPSEKTEKAMQARVRSLM